ncbi:MAG: YcaO-like family protein, partial [Spirillospora sp.]
YDQFPLRVAEASLWDPASPPRREPLVVYGAAVDLTDARRRAVLHAVELYASLTADPRRLLGDGTPGHGLVAGVSLLDGRPRTVPAATVFPRRRRSAPSGLTGVAARLSWPEAVEAALLDQWTDLVVRSPDLRGQDPPRIDPAALCLDEVGARFRDVLDLLGREYAVHDMTADKRVPTFAFTLSGRTVAYRSGVTAASAVRDGLLQLLLAYQASATGQPEYAPEPVRQLPSAPREHTAPSFEPPSAEPSAEQRRRILVETFEAAGRTPVLIPLDHDPAVVRALPYVLRVVVLADG